MISKYSVKKPYTVLVAVVLVIVLGVVSLSKMTTDLLPDMSFQYALVMTTDIGASPEKVESEVTAPIEAAMATTSNIKNISSTSYNSYSLVILEYEQNANMDSVVIEIQQKLDQLEGSWDDSVGTPMIMQINPDMLPIMVAAVDMDGMNQSEIADYVNNELIPSLESVEGVASVSASGAIEETVEVTLNQEKIDALNEKIQTSINDQFDEAQEKLDEASEQVEDGKNALESGSDALSDKIGGASGEIVDNKIDVAATKAELEDQLATLKDSYDSMDTAISSLQSTYAGAVQIKSGIDSLNQAADAYANAATTAYDMVLQQYATNMGMTPEAIETYLSSNAEAKAAFDATVATTAENIRTQVLSGVNTAMGTNYTTEAEMRQQSAALGAKLTEINALLAEQASNFESAGVTLNTYEDIPDALNKLEAAKAELEAGILAVQGGVDQITAGQDALNDASEALTAGQISGILQMANGYSDLVLAADQISSGQESLDEAKETALSSADLNSILTVSMLSQLLTAQNFDMPAGYAYEDENQYLVRVGEAIGSVEELQDVVLMDFGMDEVGIIRLSDVADVELVDNSDETYAIINGNPGIMLSMEKQTGYSTGEVTDRLLTKFDSLESANESLHLSVLMNQGVYIDMVVDSVVQNMILGAILAIFVLFLFLKDIKPTIVIACSIPMSVITAIVLMYFSGISLNIISMSGLVLGIGMLVDNSIVVIENIYRLRSEGYSIRKAAVEGASQVTGAVVASTLTTVSVYAPIIFTEGITRQLFVDLALTVAFTLIASLVVALTFVPAMSSAILKKSKDVKHPWFDRFKEWYGKVLAWCLRYKAVVFIVAIVLLVASAAASLSKGLTFLDMDMEADQLSVSITAKEDETLSFEELTECSDEVIGRISDIEGIDTIGAMISGASASSLMNGGTEKVTMYVLLDEDSDATIDEISKEIVDRTADMDCLVSTSAEAMDYASFFGSGLSIRIKGSNIETLQNLASEVAGILEDTEGTIDIEDGLDNTTPQLSISVDKEKAAEYGYTVAQVFQLVYSEMASSSSATTITTDVKDYEVYVQTEEQADPQLDDIKNLTFTYTNDDGEAEEIPLTEICTMEENTTLSVISRTAQTRYLTVSCGVDEDHNVTLVSNKVQRAIDKMDIPDGYSITMEGEDETINESMSQLVLMLVLAVIFIYLIMVAQFQSLLSPFIILFSIPLAFTGGFIALFITGQEVGIISMLGFIMLAGLIVNNGIVLIDYINQARKQGVGKKEAIIEAGKTRVRPIFMTVMTTILAMSTSAIGIGEGSQMMKPMAITIIGGLIYGTILTLIVIPCIYDAFNREKSMVEEEL